jgi:hypothetical protein
MLQTRQNQFSRNCTHWKFCCTVKQTSERSTRKIEHRTWKFLEIFSFFWSSNYTIYHSYTKINILYHCVNIQTPVLQHWPQLEYKHKSQIMPSFEQKKRKYQKKTSKNNFIYLSVLSLQHLSAHLCIINFDFKSGNHCIKT